VRRGLEPARQALGERAADRAYHQGLAMPFADAFAEGSRTPPASGGGGPLTAREADVLRLAAEGLADAAIAGRLHLSRRTVGNHLGAAYRKLGVSSRTAAIHEARELGLL
jgi:DNA-binding NarL/FixJ family response regulator